MEGILDGVQQVKQRRGSTRGSFDESLIFPDVAKGAQNISKAVLHIFGDLLDLMQASRLSRAVFHGTASRILAMMNLTSVNMIRGFNGHAKQR